MMILPSDVSGNSLRVGSINEAVSRIVSPYAVIMHGGHDCTGQSASFAYIITTPMSSMPGKKQYSKAHTIIHGKKLI